MLRDATFVTNDRFNVTMQSRQEIGDCSVLRPGGQEGVRS